MDRPAGETNGPAVYPITLGSAFRTVVTALGVFYLAVAAIVVLAMMGFEGLGDLPLWATYVVAVVAVLVASLLVYSTAIPWIGDPEHR